MNREAESWLFGCTLMRESAWQSAVLPRPRSSLQLNMANDSRPNLGAPVFGGTSGLTASGVVGISRTKQVEAYAVQDGTDWLVITIITRFF